ncbi:MAG: hypothetical protein AAFP81_14100 [Pseudomonadota bacterium]
MGGHHRLSKQTKRYLGAAIAAAVTTFMAMAALSEASAQTCTLRDATDWQIALSDPMEEQSPGYIRRVTEQFLDACPDRPEFFEASRVAGMAAADMGDADGAVRHFRNAGRMSNLLANFYAISAFAAAGDDRQAWRTRDQMVERWRSQLERSDMVSMTAEPAENGMIYQLSFRKTHHENGPRAAWVAVPYEAGWPATLSFSRDRMRLALQRTRTDPAKADFHYVDLNRCQGRRTLGRIDARYASAEFDAAARASLIAYLANPDQPQARPSKIDLCVWPARLLPSVPKRRS